MGREHHAIWEPVPREELCGLLGQARGRAVASREDEYLVQHLTAGGPESKVPSALFLTCWLGYKGGQGVLHPSSLPEAVTTANM